ncbi:ABC transporter substrate-binding protein [Skermanella sp. TT6]|uniref:ABC transporter substrate-binding protein n=1 Tax=Skermanella cutis TaxID=2775420 RepID=A0ABX7B7X2_9PROT|nr:ABC transporter substrate-binding protein [Skermanella sp. TT6]QQP89700.1 ABC transporter substrate-binding protein [Skermanella sp. TT6]
MTAVRAMKLLSAFALTLALYPVGADAADPGVFPDRIVLGQAAPFDGPAKALGTGMREGLLAAFAEANAAGGVKGRRIELVTADDGYEPERSVAATRRLIEGDGVFALVGPVGTPTSKAAQPLAEAAGVPFVGPFTGASFLRDPKLSTVVNVRASYDEEAEAWVRHLTEDLGAARIAIFYQDDSFGQAGLAGVEKAMAKRGMELAARGTYARNTTAVKSALLDIRKAAPDAVVMVGAYAPSAEFIRLARKLKMETTFVNISFVGSDALARELGAEGAGVVVSQVVPVPTDSDIPMVASYRAALAAAAPDAKPGFVSLEGYAVGRLMVEALKAIEGEPTRAALLDAIRDKGAFDLGGLPLAYGPGDNQGSDKVFMTVIQPDGSFKAVDKLTPPAKS